MQSFKEMAATRQSCRRFSGRAVETAKLLACVETARLAPSACNSQPWHFTIANGGEQAAAVARCAQGQGMNKFAANCPAFIVVAQGTGNLSSRAGGLVKQQDYASVDIGLATAHLCFEAAEQGLATCILGWFDEGALKKEIGIDKKQRVRLVIAVGYADENDRLRPKQRKPFSDICRVLAADAPTLPEERT